MLDQISLFAERIELPAIDLHDTAMLLAGWYTDPQRQVTDESPLPWIWLGAQEPHWAWEGEARGPLLIALPRLLARWPTRKLRVLPRGTPRPATVPVYIDSGAFSVIDKHGCWTTPRATFVADARRACAALGSVHHVGIQDWMCEPHMLRKTGLDVAEHQRRTVASYLDLMADAPEVPWVPTLQGFTASEYLRCAEMYERAGVALASARLVGLGSVCRRSGTDELQALIAELASALPGVQLHGYGLKSDGAIMSCSLIRSLDSDAWSRRGRGAEADLRAALGLPVDAPADQLVAAAAELRPGAPLERIDGDMADFLAWRLEHAPGGANNSLAFAEYWRGRQQMALAVAAAQQMLGLPQETNEPAAP